MSWSRFTSLLAKLQDRPEGGYDYEFVSDPPPDDYICLICTLVAREAQQASCCGKIFCKQCLKKSMRFNDDCPHCREDLNGKYFPDRRAIRDINQLKVYCENKKEGCTWEGELRRAKTHHGSCPYRHVECPNQCTEAVRSMDLPRHLETQCPSRVVKCSHCKQVGKHAYISTNHLEDCPDLHIHCPNKGCRESPKRKNMGAHRQQCPKETISCEYAKLGCKHVCLREDITDHNEKQVQGHLRLAMNELANLRALFQSRTGAPKEHLFKIANFTKLKENRETWYSPPFYAFPGGYKMCLNISAGGYGTGEGTHISAFLFLMAGENDENLEWPMRGTFSIELLNQKEDQNHKQHSVEFDETEEDDHNSKVREGRAQIGWGFHKFVEFQDLEGESLRFKTQYLKDDTLYFRVTMTEVMSTSKPWLAGVIQS